MKVYIVTAGSYSDYGIEAAFTDKAKAEFYCAENNRGIRTPYWDYHIEEYEVLDKVIDLDKIDGDDKPGYVYRIAANMVQDFSIMFKSDYEKLCITNNDEAEYLVWLSEKNEALAMKVYFDRRAIKRAKNK